MSNQANHGRRSAPWPRRPQIGDPPPSTHTSKPPSHPTPHPPQFLRYFGVSFGPSFIDNVPFPIWRPSFWERPKVEKFVAYCGVAPAEYGKYMHPFDLVISSR